MGALFSNVPVTTGDTFERPAAGGGGYGDPLERDPKAVLEDVIDGYVSVERAAKDYGVVIEEVDAEIDDFKLDESATKFLRSEQCSTRAAKATEDPEIVVEKYRSGELDQLDLVRHYGVILDWATGELLPNTIKQYREQLAKRSTSHWS